MAKKKRIGDGLQKGIRHGLTVAKLIQQAMDISLGVEVGGWIWRARCPYCKSSEEHCLTSSGKENSTPHASRIEAANRRGTMHGIAARLVDASPSKYLQ